MAFNYESNKFKCVEFTPSHAQIGIFWENQTLCCKPSNRYFLRTERQSYGKVSPETPSLCILDMIELTYWPQGDLNELLEGIFKLFLSVMADVSLVKLSPGDCYWTSLMVSQHWFRYWLGAVRHHAITWANIDPDLCHHMASLCITS